MRILTFHTYITLLALPYCSILAFVPVKQALAASIVPPVMRRQTKQNAVGIIGARAQMHNEKQTKLTMTNKDSPLAFQRDNIPNLLTMTRVIAIPVFIISYLFRLKATSFLIFVLACITDYVDGYLARKWNISSAFGAFMDPVADKLMVATALVLLTARFSTLVYIIPVALIMCREIGVSALREWMAEKGQRNTVQVGVLGKWKTAFQMIACVLLLLVFPGQSRDIDICALLNISKPGVFTAGILALYASTFLTMLSGWQYLQAAWPALTENGSIATKNDPGTLQ